MLVDVDPGQVLPGLAVPHISSSCWSCFWPRQEDWWLGPVRWHQSSWAHHARSQTLSLLLASSFQVNTEHTVVGIASEQLCGWLSAPKWGPSSASSPSFTSPPQNTKVSKTEKARNRARQQRLSQKKMVNYGYIGKYLENKSMAKFWDFPQILNSYDK